MGKGCFRVLMVASQPARQRSARRNQRCFCFLARLAGRRPRAGSATVFTPSYCAARPFFAEKKPRSAVAISGAHRGRAKDPSQSRDKRQARWCRHSQLATRLRSRKRIDLARRRSSTRSGGWLPAGGLDNHRHVPNGGVVPTHGRAGCGVPVQTVAHDTFHEPAEGRQQAGGGGLSTLCRLTHGDCRESDAGVQIALPLHPQGNRAYLQRRERSGEGARAGYTLMGETEHETAHPLLFEQAPAE
jgi:hypothetical protein